MNVGLAMAGQQYPCVIGGDWNMSVEEVEASGFPVHAQVGLVSPGQIMHGTDQRHHDRILRLELRSYAANEEVPGR